MFACRRPTAATVRRDTAGLQTRPIGRVISGPVCSWNGDAPLPARVGRDSLSTPRNCDPDDGPSSRNGSMSRSSPPSEHVAVSGVCEEAALLSATEPQNQDKRYACGTHGNANGEDDASGQVPLVLHHGRGL